MADSVQLDPDQLRAVAATVTGLQGQVGDILTTLQSNLAGRGAAWGNDSNGAKFANGTADNGYLSAQSSAYTGLQNVSDGLGAVVTGQIESADAFDSTESASAGTFNS